MDDTAIRIAAPAARGVRSGHPWVFRDSIMRAPADLAAGACMRIADEAQDRFGRKVSWGVQAGGERTLFTHIAVPVMTRLKQPERQVLDTLVDAGVARSRSDALAWSVKLVGEHTEEWLARLREAMTAVDDVRAEGPNPQ